MIFLIYLINYVNSTPGTSACSTYTNSQDCTSSGYCQWSGSCSNQYCYLVTEVGACRAGGALSASCTSLEAFSSVYDNVCIKNTETKLNYAYVRFTAGLDGLCTQSMDSTPITVAQLSASTTKTVNELFSFYTVDLLKCTSASTEIMNGLNAFLNFQSQLLTDISHPFYIERAIYSAFQVLREDRTITTKAQRTTVVQKICQVIDLYFLRLNDFIHQYFKTYYIISFGQTPMSRLTLTMNAHLHTLSIIWTTYYQNGYMQAISFPPEQFGIPDGLTDVVGIKAYNPTNTQTIPITFILKWTWTDPSLVVTAASVQVYQFRIQSTPALITGLTITCDTANKNCYTTLLQLATDNWIYYFFAYTIGGCATRNANACILSLDECTYTAPNTCS